MIRMRIMTEDYFFNNNNLMMLKRSKDKAIAPNLWTGIGGHVEANEHNSPEESCLKEIFEETGIRSNEIERLELRYILLRRSKDEIRQHYFFLGNTSKANFVNSDEGTLHWIDFPKVLTLEMSLTVESMIENFSNNPDDHLVFIGAVNHLKTEWSCLTD